jgi:hypothetical protein
MPVLTGQVVEESFLNADWEFFAGDHFRPNILSDRIPHSAIRNRKREELWIA